MNVCFNFNLQFYLSVCMYVGRSRGINYESETLQIVNVYTLIL